MGTQMIFARYEMKYLMTVQQRDALRKRMEPYMSLDRFGHSEIRNLYYDTPDYRLIRTSLERPVYKEKLRLRSYGKAGVETAAYMELKKKYRSVVHKRREALPYRDAAACLAGESPLPDTQIGREIDYVLHFYPQLAPRVFLSYEREAYYDRAGSDFRVTFDENIRYRQDALTLAGDCRGKLLLPGNTVLMELKTSGSVPLWMAQSLSELGIFKTSFSKYGSAYQDMLRNQTEGVHRYA